MTFLIFGAILTILAIHWAVSRSKFHRLGVVAPLAWCALVVGFMSRDHTLIDVRGIIAGVGGAVFLTTVWLTGAEHYRSTHSSNT